MWMPVVKVLAAIAVAAVLIWIASRKLLSGKGNDRVLRSLPGSLVQDIADRLDRPGELLDFLKEYFGVAFQGSEQSAESAEALRALLPPALPEEEFADLLRTAAAIEPDALLAYACRLPDGEIPAVITICRGPEGNGLLAGVFLPEKTA